MRCLVSSCVGSINLQVNDLFVLHTLTIYTFQKVRSWEFPFPTQFSLILLHRNFIVSDYSGRDSRDVQWSRCDSANWNENLYKSSVPPREIISFRSCQMSEIISHTSNQLLDHIVYIVNCSPLPEKLPKNSYGFQQQHRSANNSIDVGFSFVILTCRTEFAGMSTNLKGYDGFVEVTRKVMQSRSPLLQRATSMRVLHSAMPPWLLKLVCLR